MTAVVISGFSCIAVLIALFFILPAKEVNMRHRPKDIRIKGVPYRKCRRCLLAWLPDNEEAAMKQRCPGRVRT